MGDCECKTARGLFVLASIECKNLPGLKVLTGLAFNEKYFLSVVAAEMTGAKFPSGLK